MTRDDESPIKHRHEWHQESDGTFTRVTHLEWEAEPRHRLASVDKIEAHIAKWADVMTPAQLAELRRDLLGQSGAES